MAAPLAGLAAKRAVRRSTRAPAHRRRHALQLPPGQGARMGGGVGRRPRAGPGADRPGHLRGGGSRGAPPPLRGPHPGRRGAALLVGPAAHLRDPDRFPRRLAVAGADPGRVRRPGARWNRGHAGWMEPVAATAAGSAAAARRSPARRQPQAVDGPPGGPSQTPTWSSACEPGGLRRPGPPGFRPTWCCTTPPWPRWPRGRPRTAAGAARPCRASVRSRPAATVPPCCRCSPTGRRPAEGCEPRTWKTPGPAALWGRLHDGRFLHLNVSAWHNSGYRGSA